MQEFKIGGGRGSMPGWAGFMPGGLFVGLGILVLLVPDLLRLLIAALLMGLGFLLLALAWQMRRGHSSNPLMAFFQDRMRGPMGR